MDSAVSTQTPHPTVGHFNSFFQGFSAGLFAFYHDQDGNPLTSRSADGLPPFNYRYLLFSFSFFSFRGCKNGTWEPQHFPCRVWQCLRGYRKGTLDSETKWTWELACSEDQDTQGSCCLVITHCTSQYSGEAGIGCVCFFFVVDVVIVLTTKLAVVKRFRPKISNVEKYWKQLYQLCREYQSQDKNHQQDFISN